MNFKKIFTFLMIAAASMVMATEAQKMAVVDMEIIILSHPKAEENDKALRAKQAELEVQRDALLAELKAKEERIMQLDTDVRTNPAYTEKAKKEKTEEIRVLLLEYQQSEADTRTEVARMQRELSREERRLFAEVMADIQAAVKKISEEKGYTFVLDLSAYRTGAPIPIIVYNAPNTDITDDVIKAIGGTRKELPAAQ